jgi:asparagine synthase (glutamine-hydrolysing)
VLDGIDGDTTVSHGLESLPALARAGKFGTLRRELRALSGRHRLGARDLLWQLAIRPLVPVSLRLGIRRLRGQDATTLDHTVIKPEFARRMGVQDRLAAHERVHGGPARSARDAHARAMASGLIPYALEVADKTAAAFGLEARYPFFDRRLMELCLALPADQKLRGGWSRFVMRRAMAGLLPEEVRWRSSKATLAPNFKRRLVGHDRNVLTETIIEQPGPLEEYVDLAALRRAYDRCSNEPVADADALTVFATAVLGLWLQRAKIA